MSRTGREARCAGCDGVGFVYVVAGASVRITSETADLVCWQRPRPCVSCGGAGFSRIQILTGNVVRIIRMGPGQL